VKRRAEAISIATLQFSEVISPVALSSNYKTIQQLGTGKDDSPATRGDTEPMWARNGGELFYRCGDKMMSVTTRADVVFSAGKPQSLFEGRYETGNAFVSNYDVAPDGQRFVMIKANEQESAPTRFNVGVNWSQDLAHRLPSAKSHASRNAAP
jgi:hypothetical protein